MSFLPCPLGVLLFFIPLRRSNGLSAILKRRQEAHYGHIVIFHRCFSFADDLQENQNPASLTLQCPYYLILLPCSYKHVVRLKFVDGEKWTPLLSDRLYLLVSPPHSPSDASNAHQRALAISRGGADAQHILPNDQLKKQKRSCVHEHTHWFLPCPHPKDLRSPNVNPLCCAAK